MPKEYENIVTVAAVNWKGEWGNKAANLEKIKTKVRQAAQLGANMVGFAEMALTGMECSEETEKEHSPCAMHTEAAETIPGPSTEEIAKLAKELDVYVIFGMPERDKQDPTIQYNSAAVVGPEGILGSYRKIHLSPPPVAPPPAFTEIFCFKPGNKLPIFETKYGPIGVQICRDVWMYPEGCRILSLKGARIIFNSTAAPDFPGIVANLEIVTPARSRESVTFMVSCNQVGKDKTTNICGHSTIAGPAFPRLCKVYAQGGYAEEIVHATLNFEVLDVQRNVSQIKELGDWKLIAREYQQIADSMAKDRKKLVPSASE